MKVFWFKVPVEGYDPISGELILSNRHLVIDEVTEGDGRTFSVDHDGEIRNTWMTDLIIRTEVISEDSLRSGFTQMRNLWYSHRYPRYGASWHEYDELGQLRKEIEEGLDIKEIAKRHERTPSGITAQIAELLLSGELTWRVAK